MRSRGAIIAASSLAIFVVICILYTYDPRHHFRGINADGLSKSTAFPNNGDPLDDAANATLGVRIKSKAFDRMLTLDSSKRSS